MSPGISATSLYTLLTIPSTRMPSPKRCPDCGVELEALKIRTAEGHALHIATDEPIEGIWGKLGAKETFTPTPHVCPECGLTRLYVEHEQK